VKQGVRANSTGFAGDTEVQFLKSTTPFCFLQATAENISKPFYNHGRTNQRHKRDG
jgi:hypothetical protein